MKKGRVVSGVPWLRVAAAAVVIFSIGAGTFIIMKQPAAKPDQVVNMEKTTSKEPTTPEIKRKEIEEIVNIPGSSNHQKTKAIATAQQIVISAKKADNLKQKPRYIGDNKKNEIASGNNKKQEDVAAIDPDIERKNSPVNIIMDITSTKKNPQHIINNSGVTTEIAESYDITDASNRKIRGFFRKATRIFERATNINATDEDNKLLVGAFAINLK